MKHASQLREMRFGPYQVVREIGRGAMATVHEAVHRELGKRVAIKVLSDAMRSVPNGTARFFREARIVGQLHHPHIVDAIDIGESDGRPYLVMELLEGDDLESHLKRRGVLTPADTVDLLLPIVSAVSAAHASGVVHRDLKPSNILVARRGGRVHPVVVDFGVSKRDDDDVAASQLTHPETLVGTIAYMAPEQVRGARNASRLSDQYAIGVILYRCLTGQLPFVGPGEYEMMASIVNAPLVPPSKLNPAVLPALDAIVLRAMHRQASARYPSVHALGSALLELASPEAMALWSSELASDAQAQVITRAVGGRRAELPLTTQVTHVTEVLTSPRARRWHYGLLAGALAFALVATAVSRMPRFAPTLGARTESVAKLSLRKERIVTADAVTSVADPRIPPRLMAPSPRARNTAGPLTATVRLSAGAHEAPTAPGPVTGANGAPILE